MTIEALHKTLRADLKLPNNGYGLEIALATDGTVDFAIFWDGSHLGFDKSERVYSGWFSSSLRRRWERARATKAIKRHEKGLVKVRKILEEGER